MRAIFEDRFLSGQVAMRGGTVLHKVHLAPAARYSEDIDLVAVGDRPEGHVLRPVLGRERSSVWDSVQLAVRNAAKPSRILRCVYKLPSVAELQRELTIEVEVNVTERNPHFPTQRLPFSIEFRGAKLGTELVSYNINETARDEVAGCGGTVPAEEGPRPLRPLLGSVSRIRASRVRR